MKDKKWTPTVFPIMLVKQERPDVQRWTECRIRDLLLFDVPIKKSKR
jgi:hypothetical protein